MANVEIKDHCITLNNGRKMPRVGLGTWKSAPGEVGQAVKDAIKNGYRLIDCAADYGNEAEIGQALKDAMADGSVKREELFVTSKLWNTYHAKENVRKGFMRTLTDLGLEYLDLYLVHFPISLKYVPFEEKYPPSWGDFANPEFENSPLHETWREMEKLVEEGLVKSIGISNYNSGLVADVLRYAKVKPVVNQIEHHPYLLQARLVEFCQRNDIAITAYCSFGGASSVGIFPGSEEFDALNDETVKEVANKIGKSPAQVILRWQLQKGLAIIPKSVRVERLKQNLAVFDFVLGEEEVSKFDKIYERKTRRLNDPGFYIKFPIWD